MDPRQLNQVPGLLTAPSTPAPAQPAMQPAPGATPAPQQTPDLSQVYGLLAQYSENPTQVGVEYGRAMQDQQKRQDPVEQYLKLYGTINPRDYTEESLDKFHSNYVNNGQLEFSLLTRHDDLSGTEQKILDSTIESAGSTEAELGQMTQLERQFTERARQGGMRSGWVGSAEEFMKGAFGVEDPITLLRKQYDGFVTKGVLNNLPPGVASDKDIELARKPFPKGTANPAFVAAYLRGLKKIRAIELARLRYKADYLSQNTSLKDFDRYWRLNRNELAFQALEPYGGISTKGEQQYWDDLLGDVGQNPQTLPPLGGNAPPQRTQDNILGLERPQ